MEIREITDECLKPALDRKEEAYGISSAPKLEKLAYIDGQQSRIRLCSLAREIYSGNRRKSLQTRTDLLCLDSKQG